MLPNGLQLCNNQIYHQIKCIVTTVRFLGDEAISCFTNVEDKIPKNMKKYANFLCWVTGTYLDEDEYGEGSM